MQISTNLASPSKYECSNCKKDHQLSMCTHCLSTYYCSRECQVKQWPEHKKTTLGTSDWQLAQVWKKVENQAALSFKKLNVSNYWEFFTNVSQPVKAPFLEALEPLKENESKQALDLGCGSGATTLFLLSKGWKVIAIDASKPIIKSLELTIKKIEPSWLNSGQLKLAVHQVEDYILPKADLIVASDIFPYLNPKKMQSIWKAIFDALSMDGVLIGNFFTTTNADNLQAQRLMGAWIAWNEEDIHTLIQHSNYRLVKSGYRDEEKESYQFIVTKKTTIG